MNVESLERAATQRQGRGAGGEDEGRCDRPAARAARSGRTAIGAFGIAQDHLVALGQTDTRIRPTGANCQWSEGAGSKGAEGRAVAQGRGTPCGDDCRHGKSAETIGRRAGLAPARGVWDGVTSTICSGLIPLPARQARITSGARAWGSKARKASFWRMTAVRFAAMRWAVMGGPPKRLASGQDWQLRGGHGTGSLRPAVGDRCVNLPNRRGSAVERGRGVPRRGRPRLGAWSGRAVG